jgi:hypothetical protein
MYEEDEYTIRFRANGDIEIRREDSDNQITAEPLNPGWDLGPTWE